MRLLVQLSNSPKAWFGEIAEGLRLGKRYFRYKVLGVSENFDLAKFRKDALGLCSDDGQKSVMNDLLGEFPIAVVRSNFQTDWKFDIEQGKSSGPLEALDRAELLDDLKALRGNIQVGEKRHAAFTRLIGNYLPLAKKIYLLDPYAGTVLTDLEHRNRTWLLRNLAKGSKVEIEIYSAGNSEIDELALQAAVKSLNSSREPGSERIILHVLNRSRAFHARFIYFEFSHSGVCLQFDRGIDAFDYADFRHEEVITQQSEGTFWTQLSAIKKSGLVKSFR